MVVLKLQKTTVSAANFFLLWGVCKHTDQSPSGCGEVRHLERGAQEAHKASVRPMYLQAISESAHGVGKAIKNARDREN